MAESSGCGRRCFILPKKFAGEVRKIWISVRIHEFRPRFECG